MVYFDNAATTEISKEVLEDWQENIRHYGNPSATHALGQKAKVILEKSRERIGSVLGVRPDEIFLTSGATESIFHTLLSCFMDLGVKEVFYNPFEHSAVYKSLIRLHKVFPIKLHPILLESKGDLDLNHLEKLLRTSKGKSLVCIMSIQNELGTIYPVKEIGKLCQKYEAYYLCDSVQSLGKETFLPKEIPVSFCVGSGHKFHAPKGIGFLYKSSEVKGFCMQSGGGQEKNIRGGTENVLYASAMATALENAYQNLAVHHQKINELNQVLLSELKNKQIRYKVLGNTRSPWILCLSIPISIKSEMIHFKLSMKNIFISNGSACNSGAIDNKTYQNLGIDTNKEIPLRLSFSKKNTIEDCQKFVDVLYETLK